MPEILLVIAVLVAAPFVGVGLLWAVSGLWIGYLVEGWRPSLPPLPSRPTRRSFSIRRALAGARHELLYGCMIVTGFAFFLCLALAPVLLIVGLVEANVSYFWQALGVGVLAYVLYVVSLVLGDVTGERDKPQTY